MTGVRQAATWLRRHSDAHANKWAGCDIRDVLKMVADEMEVELLETPPPRKPPTSAQEEAFWKVFGE